jgi:hypothetical protein
MTLKRCKASFVAFLDGIPVAVNVGDIVEDDDRLYKASPESFEAIKITRYVSSDQGASRPEGKPVERATADPGDKRTVTPVAPTSSTPSAGSSAGSASTAKPSAGSTGQKNK